MPDTLTLNTSELQTGDVVNVAGMRCLIDGPIAERQCSQHEHADGAPCIVYSQRALVLDAEHEIEALDDGAWLAARTRETDGWPNHRPTGEHRWTIQGNHLARWDVDRGCGVCGAPVDGWTEATDASAALQRCEDCAASTAGAWHPLSYRIPDGPLAGATVLPAIRRAPESDSIGTLGMWRDDA